MRLLTDFLKKRKQRTSLNGKISRWTEVNTGVLQGSIGLLLFLIYINDSPDDLAANVKLFADNKSFFSVVHDIHSFDSDLNKELKYK